MSGERNDEVKIDLLTRGANPTRHVLVEAAVDSLDDARAAIAGGARRLELCARLDIGGTTPDAALVAAVSAMAGGAGVPVMAMVRPRGGSFVYSSAEVDAMRRDIDAVLAHGAAGIVLGALYVTGRIDEAIMRDLIARASGRIVTFHRAFDETPNLIESLETLVSLGVRRMLTSGGAATASEGIETLAMLVERAQERIGVMAGGGVRAPNVRAMVEGTGVREVHARCDSDETRIRGIVAALQGYVT